MADGDSIETAPASDDTTDVASANASAAIVVPERYQLIERLGEGGMGVVWKAHDLALERTVAFKVLHDRYLGAAYQARLAAEARAMARLTHPNVVTVYDVGVRDGRTYVTMELVRGQPLSQWLQSPRGWREIIAAFHAAGRGVAAAHAAGIVHRDLKPSNILVGDDGRVMVADFGVAGTGSAPVHDPDAPITAATASASGTLAYMAPERLAGKPADARSDLFSFCAALHEALHDERPFAGRTVAEMIRSQAGPIAPPRRKVPGWLTALIARGLARDPAARFPSMDALVAAVGRGQRRRRRAITAAAAIVLLGAGAAVIATRSEAAPCEGVEQRLAGIWDGARRRTLAAAAVASGIPDAAATWQVMDRELDGYARSWQAARRDACRATHVFHEQDATALARRNACLDQQLRAFQLVIDRFAAPTPEIYRSAAGVRGRLPLAADCATVGHEAVATAAARAARDDLALAVALLSTRDLARAETAARRALAGAVATGDRWLEVEARLALGRALHFDHPGEEAEMMTAAAELAGALGATTLQMDAWSELANAQLRLGQFDAAERMLAQVATALRDHPDPAREARLTFDQGNLLGQRRRRAESVAFNERALAMYKALDGEDSVRLLSVYRNLMLDYRALDRYDDALAAGRRMLEIAAPLGERHRDVALAHQHIGMVSFQQGRLDEARGELERAVAGLRAAAPDSADLTAALTNLGGTYYQLGDNARAAAHYRESLAISGRLHEPVKTTAHTRHNLALIVLEDDPVEGERISRGVIADWTQIFGADSMDVGTARQPLARALANQGRFTEARAELALALRSLERTLGHDHAYVADIVSDQAALQRRQRRFAAALPLDLEARRIRDKTLPEAREPIWSRVDLAQDRLGLGDARQAIALAEEAIPRFEKAGAADGTAIARWIIGSADRRRRAELAAASREALCGPGARVTDQRWRVVLACADFAAWLATR